jgi:hypothetical protein
VAGVEAGCRTPSNPYPLSMSSTSRFMNRAAGAPSTTSWSKATVKIQHVARFDAVPDDGWLPGDATHDQ